MIKQIRWIQSMKKSAYCLLGTMLLTMGVTGYVMAAPIDTGIKIPVPSQRHSDASLGLGGTSKTTDATGPVAIAKQLVGTKGVIYLRDRGLHPKNLLPMGQEGIAFVSIIENEFLQGERSTWEVAPQSSMGQKLQKEGKPLPRKEELSLTGQLLIRGDDGHVLVAPFSLAKDTLIQGEETSAKQIPLEDWQFQGMGLGDIHALLLSLVEPQQKQLKEEALQELLQYEAADRAYQATLEAMKKEKPTLETLSLADYHMAVLAGRDAKKTVYYFKDSLSLENQINYNIAIRALYLVYDRETKESYAVQGISLVPTAQFINFTEATGQSPDTTVEEVALRLGEHQILPLTLHAHVFVQSPQGFMTVQSPVPLS